MWNDLWEQIRTKRNVVLHFYSGISDSAQYYHKNGIGSFSIARCFVKEGGALQGGIYFKTQLLLLKELAQKLSRWGYQDAVDQLNCFKRSIGHLL